MRLRCLLARAAVRLARAQFLALPVGGRAVVCRASSRRRERRPAAHVRRLFPERTVTATRLPAENVFAPVSRFRAPRPLSRKFEVAALAGPSKRSAPGRANPRRRPPLLWPVALPARIPVPGRGPPVGVGGDVRATPVVAS